LPEKILSLFQTLPSSFCDKNPASAGLLSHFLSWGAFNHTLIADNTFSDWLAYQQKDIVQNNAGNRAIETCVFLTNSSEV